MAISTAILSGYLSRVVGYALKLGNFNNVTPNLPQRIVVFGEANTANQASIDTTPFEFTSVAEVGEKYGYGSPLYMMANILRSPFANRVGAIPTIIYPQLEAVGATATEIIKGAAVATTVTENATHTLVINGRRAVNGAKYDYSVVKGQNAATVVQTIIDTITAALNAPVTAALATADIAFTTKWKGVSSAEFNITFDTNGKDAGIVYSEVSKTDGAGAADITPSLALMGNEWDTLLINPYGETEFDDLETYNGTPDSITPSGRYAADVWKPLVAIFGSTEKTKAAIIAITDATARKDQLTNCLAPAPNSKGFSFEAAANMVATYAVQANEEPALGNGGKQYPDMPVPTDGDIGDFSEYIDRDYMAKRGASTVTLNSGKYTVQDFLTTYHPEGIEYPKYRKVRDLVVNWNIAFDWILTMKSKIQDKVLVADFQTTRVADSINPLQAKGIAYEKFDEWALRALITDVKFSQESTQVGVNATNPARLDISFQTKITSTADQVSTDNTFDFSFSL